MSPDLTHVSYGAFRISSTPFQHARMSPFQHAEVVERMRRAIEASNLWVLGEVDAQALVKRGGYDISGALQILAFHPRYLVRILEQDSSALLGAPIKFAILEVGDGTVAVTWTNQKMAFARYEAGELTELGEELDELCTTIVDRALS